jgi:hypothetical protein
MGARGVCERGSPALIRPHSPARALATIAWASASAARRRWMPSAPDGTCIAGRVAGVPGGARGASTRREAGRWVAGRCGGAQRVAGAQSVRPAALALCHSCRRPPRNMSHRKFEREFAGQAGRAVAKRRRPMRPAAARPARRPRARRKACSAPAHPHGPRECASSRVWRRRGRIGARTHALPPRRPAGAAAARRHRSSGGGLLAPAAPAQRPRGVARRAIWGGRPCLAPRGRTRSPRRLRLAIPPPTPRPRPPLPPLLR